MRAAVALWKSLARLPEPAVSSPIRAALLHSTPAAHSRQSSKSHLPGGGRSQDSSKTYVRFAVREKRTDAKSALKNLLFNGRSSQSNHDQTHRQKKLKARCSNSAKEERDRIRRLHNKKTLEGEGFKSFTWNWGGETFQFDPSYSKNWEKNSKKIWSESDIEEENEERGLNSVDLARQRVALGLPAFGPLNLDDIKSAFRASALKWHPDKHQGPSQAIAEEKFKLCVEAYKSLSSAFVK